MNINSADLLSEKNTSNFREHGVVDHTTREASCRSEALRQASRASAVIPGFPTCRQRDCSVGVSALSPPPHNGVFVFEFKAGMRMLETNEL